MRTLTLGPQVVWSDGNNAIFHPMMAPANSGPFVKVRIHQEMRARTAGCSYKVYARTGDDGITWDNPVFLINTSVQSNGTLGASAWLDIATLLTTVKAYIQIGVLVVGTTAGINELCVASLRVDVKSA